MADPITQRDIDYLIIAPEPLHTALAPLVAHRSAQHEVLLTSPSAIDASLPDRDGTWPSRIQRYVRQIHAESHGRTRFLLLVGDDATPDLDDEIPIGQYAPVWPELTGVPSDAYYGDMYGDRWPELAVGRIPARTPSLAHDVVEKILRYEAYPVASPTQLAFYGGTRSPFFAQHSERLNGALYTILEGLFYAIAQTEIPQGVSVDVELELPTSPFHGARPFGAVLAAGSSLFTYLGHGSASSLDTVDDFGTANTATLQIDGELPILNLLACMAGCFAHADCLGESLVLHPRGPIAVLGTGSTNRISPVVLTFFGNGLSRHLWTTAPLTLGEMFRTAQRQVESPEALLWRIVSALPRDMQQAMELVPDLPTSALVHGLQMTLLGDPAMPLQWRPMSSDTPPPPGDPRQVIRTGRVPIEERITPGTATPHATPAVDSATLSFSDLAFVLRLLDYASFSAAQEVRETTATWHLPPLLPDPATLLPQPGEITIQRGRFTVPVDRLAPLVNALFDPSDARIKQAIRTYLGANILDSAYLKRYLKTELDIDLDANARILRHAFRAFARDHLGITAHSLSLEPTIRFGVRLEQGVLTLYDLEGVVFHSANGGRTAPRTLHFDLAQ